jgi:NADH-quinone oxidoreductase subunit G
VTTDTTGEVTKQVQTVTLTIDGQKTTVPRGTTVLEAAREMGIDIPTFCWHPKLKSVGACRMCYVEIEKMPKLQVSCSLEAMDGMVVLTDSDKVRQGRRVVIEFILTNHPLDCPTCDKGGECDLQNLTFAHGFDDSRYTFMKHRWVDEGMATTFDDLKIGPEIVLNRNRCILCYKCVRANKEAFGEFDLGAFERGNITEINAAPGRKVDNPFSGNLVEICPVGALTNSDWRYKIRVWLTKQARSICPFTSSGSNTLLWKEDHQQKIFRVTSRPDDEIDDGWLADVTRYGYQMYRADDRLKTPLIKKDGKQVAAGWDEALNLVARKLKEIDDTKGNVCIGGLIAPFLDNATLHAFNKFIRVTIGSNNIDHRLDYPMLPNSADSPYSVLSSQPFSIADIDDSDVIVAFASDLLKEHPNEYLRMRKAHQFNGAKVFTLNPYAVKNADIAVADIVYRPGTHEHVINALCLAAVEMGLAEQSVGEGLKSRLPYQSADEAARQAGVDVEEIKLVARSLASAHKVSFVIGELLSRFRDREAASAALCNLVRLLKLNDKGQVARLARYCNSKGAEKLGLSPYPAPAVKAELAAVLGTMPEGEPVTTDKMMAEMSKERINAAIVMGADPVMLYPDREFARDSFSGLDFLVVCDQFETETTVLADVVLPLSSWAEFAGDYVNLEGRCQSTEAAIKPRFESLPGFDILQRLSGAMEAQLFADAAECDEQVKRLLAKDSVLPWPDDFLEVKSGSDEADPDYPVVLFIGDDPHHCAHLTEKAESLVNFCGEAYIEISPELASEIDAHEGDSVRVESPVGKIVGPVRISDLLEGKVAFVPRNFSSTAVTSLLMRKKRLNYVKTSKVAT